MQTLKQPASRRRLQRAPDFTGAELEHFSQVFLRHGLPFALLGAALLLFPGFQSEALRTLAPMLANLPLYLLGGLVVFVGLALYALYVQQSAAQLIWLLYLGALSAWEEWVFRVALPFGFAELGMSWMLAVLLANVTFGAVHYFTLRWRWQWCVGAFVGGLLLSRHLQQHSDLALLIVFHWIGTFINTPKRPGS